MKTSIIISVGSIVLMFVLINRGQANDNYLEAMQKSIAAIYQASDIPQLLDAVNALERIAAAEELKWEPQYYIAFGYVMMATREEYAAGKDQYLDRAMAAIVKAKALKPQESEILAIEGFVYMMRVTVDPGTRGPEFAPMAIQTFNKAMASNPENPRALALMARMQFGTAEFFGNSKDEACAIAMKSLVKFQTYTSANPLSPNWGKPMAEGLAEQCK